jgi:hypothetical protein
LRARCNGSASSRVAADTSLGVAAPAMGIGRPPWPTGK